MNKQHQETLEQRGARYRAEHEADLTELLKTDIDPVAVWNWLVFEANHATTDIQKDDSVRSGNGIRIDASKTSNKEVAV